MDLRTLFSQRAKVMKNAPKYLVGPLGNAMRVAFEEVSGAAGNEVQLERGWKPLMAHFTRAQVGVCETQFGTVRLWVRCVVTRHFVRHTAHPCCHSGPSTQLEFFSLPSLPAGLDHRYEGLVP